MDADVDFSRFVKVAEEYYSSLRTIEAYLENGTIIDEVYESVLNESGHTRPFETRNLLLSVEGVNTKRHHMVNVEVDFDEIELYRHNGFIRYHDMTPLDADKIDKMATKAQYGDLQKQDTRVDDKVRRGKDIPADKLRFSGEFITALTHAFRVHFRMNNIHIKPYKVNFYEDGDFFVAHWDSPEPDLIGTILFHVCGDPHALVVEGETWDAEKYNTCMFFCDVLHEVKPVKGSRETIVFKVYRDKKTRVPVETDSALIKELSMRIPEGVFGIVLQNGYTLIDNEFKGADGVIYDALIAMGKKVRVAPVIVKEITHHGHNHGMDYDDRDAKFYPLPVDSDEITNLTDQMTRLNKKHIEVYNMKNAPDSLRRMPVYFLGMGFGFGRVYNNNVYVGNEYSGTLLSNVYVNKMFVVE